MMRGRKTVVTAVRRPGGDVAINTQTLPTFYTGKLRKIPLLRGIIVLIETLYLGIQTLMYSANMALEDEKEKVSGGWIWVILIFAIAFAVALFFIVPLFLTRLISTGSSSITFNLIDGGIRLVMFIIYLKLVSFLPDIKRVFAYHGAEHMAVNAYENGVPLEVESAKRYSTAHIRCGTSFLFIVMVTAIVVFSFIGRPSLGVMVISRVLLIPVIAAIAYEITQFGGRHSKNSFVRAVLAPGMWLQSLTTRQPDDSQLEVALSALKRVVDIEQAPEAQASA